MGDDNFIINLYLRFCSPDGAWFDGASLIEPCEYFGHAAVADQELPGDVTGPDPHEGQLHYPPPDILGQGPTIDKHPAQLVNTRLACNTKSGSLSLMDGSDHFSFAESNV